MNGEIEQYDENDDLGVVIDNRMQLGKTAAKIYSAQATADTLLKLLIDKGIFTADEFIENLREREKQINETINDTVAKYAEEDRDADPKEMKDVERFLETVKEKFDHICEKRGNTKQTNNRFILQWRQ